MDTSFTGYSISISYILINISDVLSDLSDVVDGYSLLQNYPNPFNPTTNISFSFPTKSFVSLTVYDIIGREVLTH